MVLGIFTHTFLSLNRAEILTRADRVERAGAFASAFLRAEQKALWRDSDTVPVAVVRQAHQPATFSSNELLGDG